MRYLCLIYDNEKAWEKMPKEESDAVFGDYYTFTEGIKQSGQHHADSHDRASAQR